MKPRKVVDAQGLPDYVWDNGTGVDATVQLANASVEDVLQIAGQQQKVPVTGTIAVEREGRGDAGEPRTGRGRSR